MPLPNAKPDPEESNVYKQLSSIKASDLTRSQLDVIRDPLFLNDESEDVLRRILLIGQATDQLSSSGAIPRSQQIVQETYSSTGSNVFFKPPVGEVHILCGGDTLASGGTGSIQWQLSDASGTIALLFQTSVSGQEPIGQNSTNNNMITPVYITSDTYLVANVSAVATSVRASLVFIRIR